MKKLEYWPYKKQVFRHFGFLIKEYGFQIEQDNTSDFCTFVATNENCILRIIVSSRGSSVTIAPTGNALNSIKQEGYCAKPIEVGIIKKYYEPDIEQPKRWKIRSSTMLKILASYTKEHCGKMLVGDFGQWSELDKFLGDRDQAKVIT
jgi:hypothetical protein